MLRHCVLPEWCPFCAGLKSEQELAFDPRGRSGRLAGGGGGGGGAFRALGFFAACECSLQNSVVF